MKLSVPALFLSILCLACGAGCSDRVYMRVQDEDGTPVAGADVATLEGCAGLLVSTRRRYVAPAKGYVSRVEIPQSDYNNESCTLYVKLKSPELYAMVPLGSRGRGKLAYVSLEEDDPLVKWRFAYDEAVVNPYGGRVLEENEDAAKVRYGFQWDMIKSILVQGVYPPHPDLKARLANEAADTRLLKANRELELRLSQLQVRLDACVKANKKEEARKVQAEMDEYDRRCDQIVNERRILGQQHGTLNLSPAESAGKP